MGAFQSHHAAGAAGGDNIELEILRHKLHALAGEMGVPLSQTAQNPEIGEERDYATAVIDRVGGVVALDNALHLGSLARTAADVLGYFKFDMKDGDTVLTSSPYRGGTHVQDFTVLQPYVVENSVLLYLAARGHVPDIGGQVAGGYFPSAREMWAEGVPISPVKVHRYDRPVRDVLTTVLLNSRQPDLVRRVLDALFAALALGRRRVDDLIDGYGIDGVRAAMTYSQDYAERRTRAAIANWQDGQAMAEALLDHDGTGGEPVVVRVAATVTGDALSLDFSESDEQRESFVNSTISNTEGFALMPIFVLLGEDVWANSGVLRPITIDSAPGKVTHPTFPAPVGWSTVHCGAEIAETTGRALRVLASAPYGSLTVPRSLIFCRPVTDRDAHVDLSQWCIGGASASEGIDAWGRPGAVTRSLVPSIEQWEARNGIRILALEFSEDSAGSGQWRGAPGIEAWIELPKDHVYTLCIEGQRFPAQPVDGAGPGGATAVQLWEGDHMESTQESLVEQPLDAHALRIRAGGGAGFGDPFERDPQAVLDDVLDGLVSMDDAEQSYGVVLTKAKTVDADATTMSRNRRSN